MKACLPYLKNIIGCDDFSDFEGVEQTRKASPLLLLSRLLARDFDFDFFF